MLVLTHGLFAMCGSALASCFEVAYYTTCPCHKSTRVDVHGKTKERKCKKEMTVSADASEPLVIKMLAWWLSSGSCAGLDDWMICFLLLPQAHSFNG